jgi:hypothetical protein
MSKIFSAKALGMLAIATIFAGAVYGFAASNTVDDSDAGEGSGTISGYTVTNVAYTLDGTDPSTLDTVSFDITGTISAADPDIVKVKLESAGSTWYDCTIGVSPNWSCSIAGAVAVSAADELDVVAHEQ